MCCLCILRVLCMYFACICVVYFLQSARCRPCYVGHVAMCVARPCTNQNTATLTPLLADITPVGYGVRGGQYNKEYREGFTGGFLSTTAMDCHRSRRLRWQSMAKVDKNPRGDPDGVSLFYLPFPIVGSVKVNFLSYRYRTDKSTIFGMRGLWGLTINSGKGATLK